MDQDIKLPNINESQFDIPTCDKCQSKQADHAPRMLLLDGSLRQRKRKP